MATIPAPRTWTSSEQVTDAKLNADVRDSYNFHLARPRCVVYKSTDQSIGDGVETAVTWDLENTDSDGMHSNVTNNTRITAQTAGWYFLHVSFIASTDFTTTTGMHEVVFRKNGNGNLRQNRQDIWPKAGGWGFLYMQTTGHMNLGVGDYFEVMYFQSIGDTLNNETAELRVFWVRA